MDDLWPEKVNAALVAAQTIIVLLQKIGRSGEQQNPWNPINWRISEKNSNYCWMHGYLMGKFTPVKIAQWKGKMTNTSTKTDTHIRSEKKNIPSESKWIT